MATDDAPRLGTQYFDYNDNGRLWRYRYGSQTVTYAYDAFGARMTKQAGATTTHYLYDGPNLLHERTGSTTRDYIWLAGEIVGFVQGTALHYVHNDHLGRPWVITDATGQKVWEAETNAFGSAPVLDSIGGFNIGFPGQYYDEESNTWYNYFRTYDPSSGRYLQSDPIGLAGGLNTYGYAAANPLTYVDPYGLDLQDNRNRNIGIAGGCAAGAAAGAVACAASGPGYPVCEIGVIVCACGGGAILGGLAGIWADTAESTGDEGSSDSPTPDVSGNPGQPDPDDEDYIYENPGTHDPSGRGSNPYDANKSVLPPNHRELFERSVRTGPNTRWAKEGTGRNAVYHRFQISGGRWHWNGSTAGRTQSGAPREISPNNVPIEIKRMN